MRKTLERVLRPLFRCSDCDGRGQRWHAKWPSEPVEYKRGSDVISPTEGEIEKEWKTCETCRGTGRA